MSKRSRASRSDDEEDDGDSSVDPDSGHETSPQVSRHKRRRKEVTTSSSGGNDAHGLLQKLLYLQQQGPRLQGHIKPGQTTFELDQGKKIRKRQQEGEWVDDDGLVMKGDDIANDDNVQGPNVPFGRRSRAVFMEQVEDTQKDSLQPLWKAIAGAINESEDVLYDDRGLAQRQQHQDMMRQWNENEMRNLMTNVKDKVEQIEHARDLLYHKEQILDGYVKSSAALNAFRDLANVMFPNAQRQDDFQKGYANDNETLRHSSYPIVHVLAQQRLFVNHLCQRVIEQRKDRPGPNLANDTITDLDRFVFSPDIPEHFNKWFVRPRESMLDDGNSLDKAFKSCTKRFTDTFDKEHGLRLKDVIMWIRELDWYIWLRDEMLTELRHVNIDFHANPKTRMGISTALLVHQTLQASIYNFIVGVPLMKQMQRNVRLIDTGDDPVTVDQYAELIKIANHGSHETWDTFFHTLLAGHFMTEETYEGLKKAFSAMFNQITTPVKRPLDYNDPRGDTAWNLMNHWNLSVASRLNRLIFYFDMNDLARSRILNVVALIVKDAIGALPVRSFRALEKKTLVDALDLFTQRGPTGFLPVWTIDDSGNFLKLGTHSSDPKIDISHSDVKPIMTTWVDFMTHYDAYVLRGKPHDTLDSSFDILTRNGQLLVGYDIWAQDLKNDSRINVQKFGGAYSSGIIHTNAPDHDELSDIYDKQYMPSGILVPLATVVMPRLLQPLAFVLTDSLIQQSVVEPPLDVSWEVLRNDFIDDVFPIPPGAHIDAGYKAGPAIAKIKRVLAVVSNELTPDSFPENLGPTVGIIKERYRAYTTGDPTMANILTHGHSWLLPAIVLSAYLSQRDKTEQKKLTDEYNALLASLEKMEKEYQRMARGDPRSAQDVNEQRRHIRNVIHQPDPAYLMLPMFTGKKEIKPVIAQVAAKGLYDVKCYCPHLAGITLDELAHADPDSLLVTCFAEYLAAAYALKRLIWPDRFKKDKEYDINSIVRRNAMLALQKYRRDPDGTLWHTHMPGRWRDIRAAGVGAGGAGAELTRRIAIAYEI